jgi:uncharacterized protein (DUF983 family)
MTDRDDWQSMRRGWKQTCPNCGKGRMFGAYLKVVDACGSCGQELHHQRADDAPPYFTMFIVGHVVIGGLLAVEKKFHPEPWIQMAIWLPVLVLMSLWLLPRIKGAIIGHQWALKLHGFGSAPDVAAPEVWPPVLTHKSASAPHD